MRILPPRVSVGRAPILTRISADSISGAKALASPLSLVRHGDAADAVVIHLRSPSIRSSHERQPARKSFDAASRKSFASAGERGNIGSCVEIGRYIVLSGENDDSVGESEPADELFDGFPVWPIACNHGFCFRQRP